MDYANQTLKPALDRFRIRFEDCILGFIQPMAVTQNNLQWQGFCVASCQDTE